MTAIWGCSQSPLEISAYFCIFHNRKDSITTLSNMDFTFPPKWMHFSIPPSGPGLKLALGFYFFFSSETNKDCPWCITLAGWDDCLCVKETTLKQLFASAVVGQGCFLFTASHKRYQEMVAHHGHKADSNWKNGYLGLVSFACLRIPFSQ